MVDELGKTIVTVPMCLRDPKSSGLIYHRSLGFHVRSNVLTGYPPCDKALREWLLGLGTDRQKVAKRLQCFLTSLLHVTLQRLKAIEDGDTLYNYSGIKT